MMVKIVEVYFGFVDDLSFGDFVVGYFVCVQFLEDVGWYRVIIYSMLLDYKVEVYYIDYGNSDVIFLIDFRQFSSRFFSFFMQVIYCCFDFLRVEFFKENVEEKEFKVKFFLIERGKWKVNLYDDNGIIGSLDEVFFAAVLEFLDDIFEKREFL